MAGLITELLAAGGGATQGGTCGSITATLLARGSDAVLGGLEAHVSAASPVAAKAIKAILQATRPSAAPAPADAAACASLRSALLGQLAAWVTATEEGQYAQDLVSAIMPEVEHQLPASDLTALISGVLGAVEQHQRHCCALLELLPACLSALQAAAPEAEDAEEDATQAGGDADGAAAAAAAAKAASDAAKHRDAALHRLQHCKWQVEHVCPILSILRGLPLTPEQLQAFISKALRACKPAPLQQLPPILYQVLLLPSTGTRAFTLRTIINLFEQLQQPERQGNQDARGNEAPGGGAPAAEGEQPQPPQQQQQGAAAPLPSATLLQVQATLLMHISTLLKYDAALGSEWLKWLGKDTTLITKPFLLEVLMTMTCSPRLEPQVQQLLKRRIMEAAEEAAAAAGSSGSSYSSAWMGSLRSVSTCVGLAELQDGLLKAVRCSVYASELVAPGLLQLAATLISTSCSSPLHVVLALKQGSGLPPQAPSSARAVVLGLLLLQEVFEVHAEARSEVLKVVQAQLSCGNVDAALPIVLLLGRISQQQPALLSTHIAQLKDCFGSFAGLSSDTAMALLLAVWPLCRVRSDLQDFIIMLLRKTMYRQDVAGRLIAIQGFLRLICQALQDSPAPAAPALDPAVASCSQASLSQMSSLSAGRGVNLLHELTGVLRRALSQQAAVREALYAGILQVLSADPASSELLAELLLPHLRSLMVMDEQTLPPLLLGKCSAVTQTEAVLLEPLPALLACVHQLSSAPAATKQGPAGPGSLVGSENWLGPDADMADDGAEQSSTAALKACFASIRTRLGRCGVDHFNLGEAGDLNPQQLDGLQAQLHASNLLGSLQVVIEDVIGDMLRMKQDQPDKSQRDGDAVNALGAELKTLFELHHAVFKLALEGSKAGSKRGKKAASATGEGASSPPEAAAAAGVGSKRSKPCDVFVPVHKQRPHLSAACLAQLCLGAVDDGIVPLPESFSSAVDHQSKLMRESWLRAAVLRSCTAALEHVQCAAMSALLQQFGTDAAAAGGTAPAAGAASEVLVLGPGLWSLVMTLLHTATIGGREGLKPPPSSGAGSSKRPPPGPGSAGEGYESLEHLSAAALLQLLTVADSTQQLAALFRLLRSTPTARADGARGDGPAAAAAGGGDDDEAMPDADGTAAPAAVAAANPGGSSKAAASPADAAAAELAEAVVPCLPVLLQATERLLQQSCFKEAVVMVKCLQLLGKRLGARIAISTAGASNGGVRQQQREPAHTALSRWAHQQLQQVEPEVASVSLVRGLLELFIRFHDKDWVVPLTTTMKAIKEVVGDVGGSDTQATQEHGTILPMLSSSKTAQPAAATPLGILEECMGQLEKLVAASLKGGVFADDSSALATKQRRKLAAAMSTRLQGLLKVLQLLANTMCALPPLLAHQTKVATRAYKLLAALAKAYQLPKLAKAPAGGAAAGAGGEAGAGGGDGGPALSREFEALVAYVHKELTPAISTAIKDGQDDTASKSLRSLQQDAKLLPALVYAIEAWEKQLVATGNSANKINLLRDARRTFCRDFKVPRPHQQQPQHAADAPLPAAPRGGRGGGGRDASQRGGGRGGGRGRGRTTSSRATASSGSRGVGGAGRSVSRSVGGHDAAEEEEDEVQQGKEERRCCTAGREGHGQQQPQQHKGRQ